MDEETRVYSPRFDRSESYSENNKISMERPSLKTTAVWLMQRVGVLPDVANENNQTSVQPNRKTQLQERLQDMIVLELRADG
jgi:hypothetical protein